MDLRDVTNYCAVEEREKQRLLSVRKKKFTDGNSFNHHCNVSLKLMYNINRICEIGRISVAQCMHVPRCLIVAHFVCLESIKRTLMRSFANPLSVTTCHFRKRMVITQTTIRDRRHLPIYVET